MNAASFVLATLFWSVALLGHGAIGVALLNRLHAQGWPRRRIKTLTWPLRLLTLGLPLFVAVEMLRGSLAPWPPGLTSISATVASLAALAGWGYMTLVVVPRWLATRWSGPPRVVLAERVQRHSLAHVAGDDPPASSFGRFCARLPGNECWDLEVTETTLEVPGLAPELDGLVLVQASDWHFTGRVRRAYFEEVVRHINRCAGDLVLLCGDLIERTACWDWIPQTFARLRGRHGVAFVLGNHDTWIDARQTRRLLADSGLIDLGGRWHRVAFEGGSVLLAGNELPWIAPAADPAAIPVVPGEPMPLKILVAHSPDQLPWARRHGFDLMLAGHTHGGQIRFPFVGPTVCPSRFGVRYACGTFFESPTIAHVSRGISGLTPLRWNCPPQISRLVLRCPLPRGDSAEGVAAAGVVSARGV